MRFLFTITLLDAKPKPDIHHFYNFMDAFANCTTAASTTTPAFVANISGLILGAISLFLFVCNGLFRNDLADEHDWPRRPRWRRRAFMPEVVNR